MNQYCNVTQLAAIGKKNWYIEVPVVPNAFGYSTTLIATTVDDIATSLTIIGPYAGIEFNNVTDNTGIVIHFHQNCPTQ